MGRICLDGASRGAGVSRSIHDEGACRNESAAAYDILTGNRGGAARIGDAAAYIDILAAPRDAEFTACFRTDEADADIIVCFHRGLLDGGVLRGLIQLHIPLLRKAQGVPEALGADIPNLRRLAACFVKGHFRLGPVAAIAACGLAGFRIVHHAAAGHIGAAVQHGRCTRLVTGLLAADSEQFFESRLLIFNAPPVGTGTMVFVGFGDARIGTGLVGVPLVGIGVILVCCGSGLYRAGEFAALVIAEGFHFRRDGPVFPGVGGGSRLASTILPVQVGDLDLSFYAGAGRKIHQFQIFSGKVFHINGTVSVERLDLALAVLAGIENGPGDRYTAAMDFDAGEGEAVIRCVIDEIVILRVIAGLIGYGRHNGIPILDAHIDRRPGHLFRCVFRDLYHFA